tara:strand:- start:1595 stop:1981 length:387 start_codon:yes stop_codon:yes gene_type:complete
METLVQQIKLDFAIIDLYDTYVVCKVISGESLDIDRVVLLHKTYRAHYGDKKYGYIFDRTSSFTINPIAYMKCPYYPDVTAFAIVAPNPVVRKTVLFEETFSKMPLCIFDTLWDAQAWMENFHQSLSL